MMFVASNIWKRLNARVFGNLKSGITLLRVTKENILQAFVKLYDVFYEIMVRPWHTLEKKRYGLAQWAPLHF